MKKFAIYDVESAESGLPYERVGTVFYDFHDVTEELYGDFVIDTDGGPVTKEDLEEVGIEETLENLMQRAIPGTFEEANEDNREWLLDWCETWGLIPHREEEDKA